MRNGKEILEKIKSRRKRLYYRWERDDSQYELMIKNRSYISALKWVLEFGKRKR